MNFFSKRTFPSDESNRTKFLQTQRLVFDRKSINLESYQLIYLAEPTIELQDKFNIQMLRKIVDYTRIFTDSETCWRYLEETCGITTFMICTNEQGKKLIPKIYKQKNICSIYVYCENSCDNLSWTSRFEKVKYCLT